MTVTAVIFGMGLTGPIVGVAFALLFARARHRPITTRRVLISGTAGGVVGIAPLTVVAWLGAYGAVYVPPVGLAVGLLYGMLIGAGAIGIRRWLAER